MEEWSPHLKRGSRVRQKSSVSASVRTMKENALKTLKLREDSLIMSNSFLGHYKVGSEEAQGSMSTRYQARVIRMRSMMVVTVLLVSHECGSTNSLQCAVPAMHWSRTLQSWW